MKRQLWNPTTEKSWTDFMRGGFSGMFIASEQVFRPAKVVMGPLFFAVGFIAVCITVALV